MKKRDMQTSCWLAGLCAIFLAAVMPVIAFAGPAAPVAPNTVLIIDGTPEQLAAFDRALRPQIPVRYEQYGLGCTVDYLDGDGDEGCAVMRPGNPVPDDLEYLAYYFNDANKPLYAKFEKARGRVRRKFPGKPLLLTFRRHEEAAPDCTAQPQPCVNVPYCPQFGNCSTLAASCKRC